MTSGNEHVRLGHQTFWAHSDGDQQLVETDRD